jgi:hypothetical protein
MELFNYLKWDERQHFESMPQSVVARIEKAQNSHELPLHTNPKGQLILALYGYVTCEVAGKMWMVPTHSAIWIPAHTQHSNRAFNHAILCHVFIQPSELRMPDHTCTLAISPLAKELMSHFASLDPHYSIFSGTNPMDQVLKSIFSGTNPMDQVLKSIFSATNPMAQVLKSIFSATNPMAQVLNSISSGANPMVQVLHSIFSATNRMAQVLIDVLSDMLQQPLDLPLSTHPTVSLLVGQLFSQPGDRKTLTQWAAQFAMTERTLARLIKKEIGMTFGRWRNQLHVIVAMQNSPAKCPCKGCQNILVITR